MTTQSKHLAERLKAFNDEMIRFIQSVDENQWRKQCDSETWRLGVVARHVGAGHYRAVELAKMIIAGQSLPEMSHEAIDQMNAAHASKNADCTKEQVLAIFETHGNAMVAYIAGLSDAELNRSAHFPAFNAPVSAGRLIEEMVLNSGGEHLTSMKKTAGS